MYTSEEERALNELFDILAETIRNRTREEALDAAEAARKLCQSFLQLGKMAQHEHLAIGKKVKAEILYFDIAQVAKKLLAHGCERHKLVTKLREEWTNEGLARPVASASTIRTALKQHNM